jgi:hypothetical protein
MSYEFKEYLKTKHNDNNLDNNKKEKIKRKIQDEIDELRAQYKINKKHNTKFDNNSDKEDEEADENYQIADSHIIDKPLQMTKKNILEDENSLLISDRKEIAAFVEEKTNYQIFDKAKNNLMKLKNDLEELDQYDLSRHVINHDEYITIILVR